MFYLLQLNNKCNNNCIFCARECSLDELSLKKVYSKINQLDKQVNTVILSGGETLMYSHLFKVIRKLKQKGLKIILQTNATLVTPAIAYKLASLGVDNIVVNFNGLEKEYSAITRNPIAFKYALRGLKTLAKYSKKYSLEIVIVINKVNYDKLVEISKLVSSISTNITIYFSYIQQCTKSLDLIKKYAIEYDKLKLPLNDALNFCYSKKLKIKLSHIPFCYINKKYHYAVIDGKEDNPDFLEDFIDDDKVLVFDNKKEAKEFVYISKCEKCILKNDCSGFPDYYNKVFIEEKEIYNNILDYVAKNTIYKNEINVIKNYYNNGFLDSTFPLEFSLQLKENEVNFLRLNVNFEYNVDFNILFGFLNQLSGFVSKKVLSFVTTILKRYREDLMASIIFNFDFKAGRFKFYFGVKNQLILKKFVNDMLKINSKMLYSKKTIIFAIEFLENNLLFDIYEHFNPDVHICFKNNKLIKDSNIYNMPIQFHVTKYDSHNNIIQKAVYFSFCYNLSKINYLLNKDIKLPLVLKTTNIIYLSINNTGYINLYYVPSTLDRDDKFLNII
jgi:MoaA/NifB/PqqE/SkfB family radical SAM enzyme